MMSLFAILAEKPNPELANQIKELYPTESYQLSDSQWMVSSPAIANTLAEQLDVRAGRFGKVLVIRVKGSGAGWHAKTVWEWLRAKSENA